MIKNWLCNKKDICSSDTCEHSVPHEHDSIEHSSCKEDVCGHLCITVKCEEIEKPKWDV